MGTKADGRERNHLMYALPKGTVKKVGKGRLTIRKIRREDRGIAHADERLIGRFPQPSELPGSPVADWSSFCPFITGESAARSPGRSISRAPVSATQVPLSRRTEPVWSSRTDQIAHPVTADLHHQP